MLSNTAELSVITADTAETAQHKAGMEKGVIQVQNHQNVLTDRQAAQDAATPARIIQATISPVTAEME